MPRDVGQEELKARAHVEAQQHRKQIRKHIDKLLDDIEKTDSITIYEVQAARLSNNVIMFMRSHEFRIKESGGFNA